MVQEIDVTDGSDSGTEVECSWIKEEGLADLFQVIGEIPTVKRIHGLEFCKALSLTWSSVFSIDWRNLSCVMVIIIIMMIRIKKWKASST